MSLSDALGLGPEVKLGDKVYRLAPMDQLKVRGRYSAYLKQRAIQSVLAMRGEVDPATIDSMMAAVTRDFAAGVYDFGQEVVKSSLRTEENMHRMVLYMLQEHHPEADLPLVREMFAQEADQVLSAIESHLESRRPKAAAPAPPAA